MKSFFDAVRFLTVIPIPDRLCGGNAGLSKSAVFFPVVGLMTGAIVVLFYHAFLLFLPHVPSACIAVLVMSWISGGLHMDGLADTADGFLSGAPRERAMEIMKDSRTGAFGALAMTSVLLLKVSALSSVMPEMVMTAVISASVAGRGAMTFAIYKFKYVTANGVGLGTLFANGMSGRSATISVLIVASVVSIFIGWSGIFVVATFLLITILFGIYSTKKIGGMTGDTYGALCEMTETLVLLVIVAVVGIP